jgi:hypothetical protein
MSTAPATETTQNTAHSPDRATHPAPRFTAGFADALGERVLMFDDTAGSSLELLRIKREISEVPGFEAALNQRIESVASVRHPALCVVKNAERRGATNDLTLISKHTPGRRLSEILQAAKGAAFALDFLNQIGPAVAALHQKGAAFAHGALSVDRVIVGREGRLVLVEHVLGSALSTLKLPAVRLRAELGLATPAGADVPALDQRLDVIQLGFIAITLLLGRRLDPADYPGKVSEHLDSFAKEDAATAVRLRPWLEKALQIGEKPFADAKEALKAFEAIADTSGAATATDPAKAAATPPTTPASGKETTTIHVTSPASSSSLFPAESRVEESGAPRKNSGRMLTGILGVLVVAEAAVIAGLLYTRTDAMAGAVVPLSASTQDAAPAPPAPESANPVEVPAPPIEAPPAPVPAPAPPATAALPLTASPKNESEPAAAPGSRFGGLRIASPIDLQVLEGGRIIGSTSGPIAVADGAHTLELVNETLGFRFRQSVQVRPGQMTTLNISVPNGRISVNAAPWAEVWIDGKAAGQTPLANLSLPIGQHEVVFRHPQFGEQKQTVTVKAEGLTRVSAVFQK